MSIVFLALLVRIQGCFGNHAADCSCQNPLKSKVVPHSLKKEPLIFSKTFTIALVLDVVVVQFSLVYFCDFVKTNYSHLHIITDNLRLCT